MREVRGAEMRSVGGFWVSDGFGRMLCVRECISTRGGLSVKRWKVFLRWRGGSSTDACGAEGVVYLVWRDGVGGGGLGVLDCFGGECLDFHCEVFRNLHLWKCCGEKRVFTRIGQRYI